MEEKNKPSISNFFKGIATRIGSFFSANRAEYSLDSAAVYASDMSEKSKGLGALAEEVKAKELKELKKAKRKKSKKRKSTKKTVEELKKTISDLKEKMKSLELDLANKRIGEEEFKRKMAEAQVLLTKAENKNNYERDASQMPALHVKLKDNVDEPRLNRIEQKLDNLMDKHNVRKDEIQEHTADVDVNKVLKSIDNLATLVELEKKSNYIEKMPFVEPEHFGHAKNKEEIKTIAMDIKKHRIITSMDKILSAAQEKKKIGYADIKDLGITQKEFKEYADILKQEGLVELSYSPIGSLYLKYIEQKEES